VSARPYITCRALIDEFLADYFEGALGDMQAEDFQRHLSVCPSCRAYLETYRKAMLAGKRAVRDDDASDAPEELIRAILAIRRT